jgi:hypothetical protein
MTMRITQPGIYLDMSAVDYFADPCPSPSLTQSVAKRLIDRSPLHAWTIHPRLNPAFEADDPTKYDIGNIAHRLLLGRGKELPSSRPTTGAPRPPRKPARPQRRSASAASYRATMPSRRK